MEELSACPGIGPTKVRRLYETFHEPFRRTVHPQHPGGDDAPVETAETTAVGHDTVAEIGGDEDEIEEYRL